MKILYLFLWIFSCSILSASIYTVDNKPFPIGDYTSIQDAHNAVDANDTEADTIMVYPSKNVYTGGTISKQVVLIGSGWDDDTGDDMYKSLLSYISFEDGSQGSILEGFDSEYSSSGYSLNVIIKTNSITIKRNRLKKIIIYGNHDINIIQNTIEFYGTAISILENSELQLFNNIIIGGGAVAGHADYPLLEGGLNVKVNFINNILRSKTNSKYFYMEFDSSYLLFAHNFFIYTDIRTPYPADMVNNTGFGIPNTVYCVDPQNNNYHLLESSPARKEVTGAEYDIGIYDGIYPFVDDGAPGIPTILDINSSLMVTPQDGLDVEIKVKSNR